MKIKFCILIILILCASELLLSSCTEKNGEKEKDDVPDFREKYVGEWFFKVTNLGWEEFYNDRFTLNDSIYSRAVLSKGFEDNTLTIAFDNAALKHPFYPRTFYVDSLGNIIYHYGENGVLKGKFEAINKVIYTYTSHPPGVWYLCRFLGERSTDSGTLNKIPSVSTDPATGSKITSATLNGTVIANFLSSTLHFEYGSSNQYGNTVATTPFIADGFSIVKVSAEIQGLKAGEQYHFRLKAENSSGVAYGKDQKFTTLLGPISDIEGNEYYTAKIGSQTWMASNLRSIKYNDGTEITLITDASAWKSLLSEGFCWYNNQQSLATNGALYNWYAVNTGKLCPSGWHIPTESDWSILISFLGGDKLAGGKLKEEGFIHWNSPNIGATNETSFFAIAGGVRYYYDGLFKYIGTQGSWWSSDITASTNNTQPRISLTFSSSEVSRLKAFKTDGLSVRCIKDN